MSQHRVPAEALAEQVVAVGRAAGLVAVGVARAEPFDDVRLILEQRRNAGLSADMQFTYRNPARSTDPTRALEGARSLVVGAWPYPARVDPPESTGGAGPFNAGPTNAGPVRDDSDDARPLGRVARYATGDHYGQLRSALELMADHLRTAGYQARVLADDNALVDRAAAHRAGIGWFGKNANILVPGHGSWVVLGAVLTDAELPAAAEPVPDGCGACRRCLDGCPTAAIVAPGVVDARRCLAWLVQAPGVFPAEFRVALGDRIYGCDDCQEVCPPNRRPGAVAAVGPDGWVDLLDMLAASDDQLLDRHGRWYIARRDPMYLRRNALLALGNVAPPNNPLVAAVLSDHLAHHEPLVRAHAVWAVRRLGRDDLLVHLTGADDPLVMAELALPSPVPR
jgi:epoxyqueuosine reductase